MSALMRYNATRSLEILSDVVRSQFFDPGYSAKEFMFYPGVCLFVCLFACLLAKKSYVKLLVGSQ